MYVYIINILYKYTADLNYIFLLQQSTMIEISVGGIQNRIYIQSNYDNGIIVFGEIISNSKFEINSTLS